MHGIPLPCLSWSSQLLLGLDKLQKQACTAVGLLLAASCEPLAHYQNIASLSLFYKYYFGRYSSEMAELVPLPPSHGRSTRYSNKLHHSTLTIPIFFEDINVNSFFLRTAGLCNYFPKERFSLIYNLNAFKSRVNRSFLPLSFLNTFLCCFSSFSCNSLPCNDCSALCGVNPKGYRKL